MLITITTDQSSSNSILNDSVAIRSCSYNCYLSLTQFQWVSLATLAYTVAVRILAYLRWLRCCLEKRDRWGGSEKESECFESFPCESFICVRKQTCLLWCFYRLLAVALYLVPPFSRPQQNLNPSSHSQTSTSAAVMSSTRDTPLRGSCVNIWYPLSLYASLVCWFYLPHETKDTSQLSFLLQAFSCNKH